MELKHEHFAVLDNITESNEMISVRKFREFGLCWFHQNTIDVTNALFDLIEKAPLNNPINEIIQ